MNELPCDLSFRGRFLVNLTAPMLFETLVVACWRTKLNILARILDDLKAKCKVVESDSQKVDISHGVSAR